MQQAYLKEIFYSIQGEGKYVGTSQYFVRFCECNLRCPYCDTDFAKSAWCEVGSFSKIENPLTAKDVLNSIAELKVQRPQKIVSLTGGEPLLQVDFLKELLPLLKKEGFQCYLETNGTLPEALRVIINDIDIIAMDLKLQHFADAEFIANQRTFLELAKRQEVFVKIVFDEKIEHLDKAIELLAAVGNTPLYLQPVQGKRVSAELINKIKEKALEKISEVRFFPQIQTILNIK